MNSINGFEKINIKKETDCFDKLNKVLEQQHFNNQTKCKKCSSHPENGGNGICCCTTCLDIIK